MNALRIGKSEIEAMLPRGWGYGDVYLSPDVEESCEDDPTDLPVLLAHHMDLGYYRCGLDGLQEGSISKFTTDGVILKSTFLLESGMVSIVTDPKRGVTVVMGFSEFDFGFEGFQAETSDDANWANVAQAMGVPC
jgi:hypothetical protein